MANNPAMAEAAAIAEKNMDVFRRALKQKAAKRTEQQGDLGGPMSKDAWELARQDFRDAMDQGTEAMQQWLEDFREAMRAMHEKRRARALVAAADAKGGQG